MGMPYIGEGCLIALKALAWREMRERKAVGAEIDSKHIRKHLMDVLSLAQVLTPESRFEVSSRIASDIARFTDEARIEKPDISRFGRSMTLEGMLQRIQAAFSAP